MASPALEFVKMLAHLVSLDGALQPALLRLRRNLLKMLDVREFATEAQFVNPCRTYVLPDVMCGFVSTKCRFECGRRPHHPEWEYSLDLIDAWSGAIRPHRNSPRSYVRNSRPVAENGRALAPRAVRLARTTIRRDHM